MTHPKKPDSLIGRFWLPGSDESTSIAGVLDFNKEGATVRLEGFFPGNRLLQDAIVFARFHDDGAPGTLYNCFGGASYRDGQVSTSHLTSTLVAVGCHSIDLMGYAIQFRLENSSSWFYEQCFDVDLCRESGESNDVVVRFKSFESTRTALTSELELERFYAASVTVGWGKELLKVRRPMAYRIRSSAARSFDCLWDQMTFLRRLLEFFAQHPMPHEDLFLFSDSEGDAVADVRVHHSYVHRTSPKKFDHQQQLVSYRDLGQRLPEILRRWYEVRRSTPEPFERYFAAFDRDSEDATLHFLWNAAALEELHKIRTSRKRIDLIDRLKDIRTRWTGAFASLPSDLVLEEIKDTRHYYAHAAGDLRDRAAKDWVLLRYGHFLAALSNLEILAILGFNDDEIRTIARKYWMREALSLRLFPTQS